jgi:SAM-dependent methyltransferase
MPKCSPTHTAFRDAARAHYEVEVELARRLRGAPKEERLGGLYASIYRERLERIPEHPLLVRSKDRDARDRAAAQQLRLLDPYLAPANVFMEVGPGDCALAIAVASRVKTVYAIDVTDALIADVERPKNLHLLSSNGVTIPVPAETVHLAYSNQVLEHLHPDDAYDHLLAIHATLVPGGQLVCITPNRLSGPWDISRHFNQTATGLHLREYTLSEEIDLLRAVGFTVSLFASYNGRRILPLVPEAPVRALETFLERLPRRLSRPMASSLVAIKVLATKPGESARPTTTAPRG